MKVILLICLMFVCNRIQAQNIHATAENGKKVVLYENGTWKYEEEDKKQKTNMDSNDCTNWLVKQEDKVSGTSVIVMKNPLIISQDGGENGLAVRLILSGTNVIILSILANGAGRCIDKNAKINILFKDGSRMELLNESDFNCKGNATIYFGGIFGKKNKLSELKNKNIETIRVWTNDSYVQETLDEEQSANFKNSISCMIK